MQSRTQAQQDALAAYRGMWAAYAKAGLTANPDDPDLAAVAADQALTVLRTGLTETRDKGQRFKGSYESHPQVVTASPAEHPVSILIADCLDTTKFRTYTSSGQLTDNKRGGRRATGATVRRLDGVWKVVSFGVREKGTC